MGAPVRRRWRSRLPSWLRGEWHWMHIAMWYTKYSPRWIAVSESAPDAVSRGTVESPLEGWVASWPRTAAVAAIINEIATTKTCLDRHMASPQLSMSDVRPAGPRSREGNGPAGDVIPWAGGRGNEDRNTRSCTADTEASRRVPTIPSAFPPWSRRGTIGGRGVRRLDRPRRLAGRDFGGRTRWLSANVAVAIGGGRRAAGERVVDCRDDLPAGQVDARAAVVVQIDGLSRLRGDIGSSWNSSVTTPATCSETRALPPAADNAPTPARTPVLRP